MHVWKRVHAHTHRFYYSNSDAWTVAICSLQNIRPSNQIYLWSTKGGVGGKYMYRFNTTSATFYRAVKPTR
jgi:hypothetical protein